MKCFNTYGFSTPSSVLLRSSMCDLFLPLIRKTTILQQSFWNRSSKEVWLWDVMFFCGQERGMSYLGVAKLFVRIECAISFSLCSFIYIYNHIVSNYIIHYHTVYCIIYHIICSWWWKSYLPCLMNVVDSKIKEKTNGCSPKPVGQTTR